MNSIFLILLFPLSCAYIINNSTFPKNFMFGVATAAYQIEGGWNADGKGENIWDYVVHKNASFIKNGNNGDIACDSYHKYKEDIALLKDLGVTHYRFSIAWSRILPEGITNKINKAGVAYYRNLITELKTNNIEPLVTLHHWDTPQALEELGGFLNEDIIDWYTDYARLCFELYGELVKYWVTFNEPKQTCYNGYGIGSYAPARVNSGIGEYICSHNVLKAHAKTYHMYDKEYRPKYKGKVSLVIDTDWYEPETNSTADIEASEIKQLFTYGWYAHPIVFGDYPEIMKSRIADRSKRQGFPRSRLPSFTEEEKAYMKGTYDFLAVNSYTADVVRPFSDRKLSVRDWDVDAEVTVYQPETWEKTGDPGMKFTPWGMRKLLKWVSNTYGNPDIIITENGICDNDGKLDDDQRIRFIRETISNVKDSMDLDGVKVFGYTVWSFLDNLEWTVGYTEKFGITQVNFDSPNRTRTPKKSSEFYKNVIKTRCLVDKCVQ